MKLAIFILCLPFIFSPKYAISGYFPWGWQGWLQSVATITDAPSSGVLLGSVVFAQDNDDLYYWDGSEWTELSGGGGSGTVTSVSVVSANGFAGTVADATTTPAITMETSITGLLHGNGTAVAAETVSSPLNESSGTLSCLTASGSQAGCLSSTDWSTFNSKQSTLTFSDSLVNSGGTVTLSGDTASPGDSQYYGTDSGGTLGYFDLPGSGVTTVGTFGSQSSAANGAVISGSDIYFQDFTSSNPGMAPASGGGTTNFLRADGSWAAPSGGGGTPGGSSTDVQYNSSGSFAGDSGFTYDGSGSVTLSSKMSSASANISGLTDSEAVFTDGSDNLVSNAITGTGSVVMSTSPTLVTPALGTPSALVLTNATGLPISGGGTGNGSLAVTAGGVFYSDGTKFQNVGAGTSGQILSSNGSSAPSWANNGSVISPGVTSYTSGSGTYTTPTGPSPLYLRVICIGGGGGGGGTANSVNNDAGSGADGTATTFGTSLLSAAGGFGGSGVQGGGPGLGGSFAINSPATGLGRAGAPGGSNGDGQAPNVGGSGGGNGGGTANYSEAGGAGAANSGGGGAGGSTTNTVAGSGGFGAGAGGYIDALIPSPSSSYSYAVGGGGTGGSAGTSGANGGAGGSGLILVYAYYQ